MSTTITRVYDTYGNALRAVNELKRIGYGDASVALFSDATNSGEVAHASGGGDQLVATLGGWGVPAGDAAGLAGHVGQGKSLVVAKAALGAATRAIAIVDRFGPNEDKVGAKSYYSSSYLIAEKDRTPLSSALNWPLLWSDSTPFSKFWNMPALSASGLNLSKWLNLPTLVSRKEGGGFTFGMPKLFESPDMLSAAFNLPSLWNPPKPKAPRIVRKSTYSIEKDSAPLSSMLGLPTSWRASATSATFWNFPTLIKNGPALSEALKFPTLLGGGKDGSAYLFGIPKLLQSPAVFSSILSVPVLWNPPAKKG